MTGGIHAADERALLEEFLDANRAAVAGLVDAVSEAEARACLVPSLTTLLGLVKHAAFVERVWFQCSLGGRSRAELGLPRDLDDTFRLAAEDCLDSVRADFEAACAESRALARAYDLQHVARHYRRGPLTLRWIYVHLIEEHARHAGHGDILREQLLTRRPGP